MTKAEILEKFGLNDGHDEERFTKACQLSAELDTPLFKCFETLISLEKKGLIQLVSKQQKTKDI